MVVVGSSSDEQLFRGSPQYWERAQGIRLGESELDFLSINLRPICNYACTNCLSGMGDRRDIFRNLSLEETQELITDARGLGVLAIEISGEGEPLADRRRLLEIIDHNNRLRIITTLFSNGSLLDRPTLEYFAENNVSLAISLDHFNRRDYEIGTCRTESFDRLIENISLAREVYSRHQAVENGYQTRRLAIHSITNAQNLDQIPLIAEFCADDIFYSVAPIANVGNATEHPELTEVNQQRVQEIIERYSDGDLILSDSVRRECGQDRCGTFMYGIGLRHDGEVLFDAHAFTTSGIIGNVRDLRLGELISRQRELRDIFYEQFSTGGFCPLRDPNYHRFEQHIRGGQND